MIKQIEPVHPYLLARVKEAMAETEREFSIKMFIVCGYRYPEEQAIAYAKGRTIMGPRCKCLSVPCKDHPFGLTVTNASPIRSYHPYGLAVDCVFRGDDPYLERHPNRNIMWRSFGSFCRGKKLTWGGDFRAVDMAHVQLDAGLSVDQCIDLYRRSGIELVWKEVNRITGSQEVSTYRGEMPNWNLEKWMPKKSVIA